ncbi:MAG TPA: alpha/beta hydrolase [Pyrinomonadaceae bacterium]|nr:alpha/beta hydrolase [Pyrinomonadaceae bacterium]
MFFTDSYQAMRRGERRLALRYAMISVAIFLLLFVPLGVFLLRRLEHAMTFHPVAYTGDAQWALPERAEEVWFETADGVRLHGWFIRATTVDAPSSATVIYFHGNGGNLSYTGWLGAALSRRGMDALLFDYRGYGRSGGSLSGEESIYADADAAYDYVVRTRGVPASRVVLYGQSLGSAAAADLAARKECGALILESGLSSAGEMAGVVFPWLPRFVRGLTRNKFDTARKLARVRCPVMVAHGARDEIIPAAQGRALYEAAREPKKLVMVEGAGHNNLVATGGNAYLDALAQFVRESVGQ